MSLSDELYKEVILDHFENPRNYYVLANPNVRERGVNPLCGDEFELFLSFDGDKIKEASFQGKGCSISQASGSMMTELIQGKTKEEAFTLIEKFKGMILEDKDPNYSDEEADLEALNGVKKYPVRVKCAVLCWNTLDKALKG
ncbi:MAG TPA: SUF system NifU family Fe-S cluster assembly protein [Leptospiraceae bacterium]|nr:SUF system NifU family Fe-S cluster assembly protein [Leptospiraceae bacterium]HMX33824.1 SUF system NifU family Fe-S cluster assembly protein [Leptospiraceae bacterium]HMZ66898.1 SUF system NifU family Fe-S cluster assembly protein [Leptospiraceae bacterium]HNA09542.1 SUF system NifU family Fe-S cluster assembly protein [Leptospiraceae bacterium]HNC00038.1 SUF system NifU family Fe-S cluster assembly protein [Leptospiraceae bacterium]